MKNYVIIFLLLVGINVYAQVTAPYVVNFENHENGQYTLLMASQDFPNADWYHGMEYGRSEIVDEDGNKVLRVKYPKSCVGPNYAAGCGIQIKWPLPETADVMWVSYRIKFEEGFEFVKGGKLPGLCGGKCYTGGTTPQQGDGWSARIMWRTGGKVVQYMYFTDQASTYGDDLLWDESGTQSVFVPGQWHTVVTQVVLNEVPEGTSTGSKNGIVRSWFDGELALEVNTLQLVDFKDQTIDMFYISTFHGGDDATWAPTTDSYIRFDDFWIAKDAPEDIGNPMGIDFSQAEQAENGFISHSNPTADELHIESHKSVREVTIFSSVGESVLQSQDAIVKVNGLKPGVYILYVTFEDGSSFKTKILKL